ncbi:uncharacterized protein LOC129588231 [Paramacrobiotus metropolitanus]|uniref:uncharacterized protein LOC129588231 n=1 Tax=Paramacrobiotus metropolitanus TaxID=2943436 RepID=UPI00244658C5|nr:uncharacterized protein LOC129588231 [Paramacrobiotus metropolitanus]
MNDAYGKLPTDYAAYACVFKYITPATRNICNRDAHDECEDGFELESATVTGELILHIGKVLRASNIRIDRLIMYQRYISMPIEDNSVWDFFAGSYEMYAQLKSCCERLIWKDLSLTFSIAVDVNHLPHMEFHIPFAVFPLENFSAVDMYDFYETHLCWNERLDLDRLTRRTARLNGGKGDRFHDNIIDILDMCQVDDPRPSAQYTGRDWLLDNTDELDARRLNKLCRYVLSCLVGNFTDWSSQPSDSSEGSEEESAQEAET